MYYPDDLLAESIKSSFSALFSFYFFGVVISYGFTGVTFGPFTFVGFLSLDSYVLVWATGTDFPLDGVVCFELLFECSLSFSGGWYLAFFEKTLIYFLSFFYSSKLERMAFVVSPPTDFLDDLGLLFNLFWLETELIALCGLSCCIRLGVKLRFVSSVSLSLL